MSATACTLVTIPISHYCEKARWALDRAGVRYRERRHLQGIHRIAARLAGGGLTVPVLVTPERVLPESDEIVAWADARTPAERRLFPDDPALAAEVRALERDFDERLGPHGRRWMYNELRERVDIAFRYAPQGIPSWERRTMPLTFPVISRVIDRVLDITPETAALSLTEVDATFDEMGERLADGRPYLVGDRFTAADLTFAALAASVLLPEQYGVPLPRLDELPAGMAAKVRELRGTRAGRHALAMYERERRPHA